MNLFIGAVLPTILFISTLDICALAGILGEERERERAKGTMHGTFRVGRLYDCLRSLVGYFSHLYADDAVSVLGIRANERSAFVLVFCVCVCSWIGGGGTG